MNKDKLPNHTYYSLALYNECPRCYKYEYVDRLLKSDLLQLPFYSMASSVHKATEKFMAQAPGSTRTIGQLMKNLREVWNGDAYDNREEDKAYFERAAGILRNLPEIFDLLTAADQCNVILKATVASGPAGIEGTEISERVSWLIGSTAYRMIVTPYPIKPENYEFLAGLLAMVMKENQRACDKVVFVEPMKKATTVINITDALIAAARRRVTTTVGLIKADRLYPVVPGDRCEFCDFRLICPVWLVGDYAEDFQDPTLLLEKVMRNLFIVTKATRRLGSIFDQDQVFKRYLSLLMQIADAEIGSIFILDRNGNEIVCKAHAGIPAEHVERLTFAPGEGILGQVMTTGQALMVDDVNANPRFKKFDFQTGAAAPASILCIPLEVSGEVIGAVSLSNKVNHTRFSIDDLVLVSSLGQHLNTALENIKIHDQLTDQKVLRQQMETARSIQKSFLPEKLPEIDGYEFDALDIPAFGVGGDFYDFILLPDGRLAMVIADVSGKGVGAALYMAKCISELRIQLHLHPSPITALKLINTMVFRQSFRGTFITACMLVLDRKDHSVEIINAGHLHPVWYKEKSGGLTQVSKSVGIPLGINEDITLMAERLTLEPGDNIFMFTDGVLEAKDRTGKMFGLDRFCDVVKTATGSLKKKRGTIIATLLEHIHDQPHSDDITLVCLRRK